ncbi:hypothetical protein ACT17Q_14935 [Cellulomonas sp. CW35]|uniref:hypothetical protein n=1 Tax=Cellulomonas sp. CW35 TaxID=3458249 RepID=UPI0040334E45
MHPQHTPALARLERYTPACLTAAQWTAARVAVLDAVRLVGPATPEDAKGLVSRLCLYLASPCGWGGTSAPDLPVLLRERRLNSYLAALTTTRAGKTVENHRADLRRISRAVNGVPPVPRGSPRRRPSASARADHTLCDLPISFAAIAAAASTHAGGGSVRSTLEPWIAAASAVTATLTSTRGCDAAGLAAAVDVTPRSMSTTPDKSSPPRVDRPQRPVARAAALRMARHAAAEAATAAAPKRFVVPDLEALAPEVQRAIAAYEPQAVDDRDWARVADLARLMVTAYGPTTPAVTTSIFSHVVRFLRWHTAEHPASELTAVDLLDLALVDRHLDADPGPARSVATRRSALRRAIRALDPGPQAPRIPHQAVSPPYTPAECVAFVRLARNQPTEARRRQLGFVVGLALGAGLDGRDLRHVRRRDVSTAVAGPGSEVLLVQVRDGSRPRTVVVRDQYRGLVQDALGLHDSAKRDADQLLLGVSDTRRNITSPALGQAVTARAGQSVDIDVNRLRSTWLCALMSAPLPLAAVLRAAGLRSARTLTDLLEYCPEPAPDDVRAALAHLRDAESAEAVSP